MLYRAFDLSVVASAAARQSRRRALPTFEHRAGLQLVWYAKSAGDMYRLATECRHVRSKPS